MIWAMVHSWSCFCWLYRASPSLAGKNTINLILILTIWSWPCIEYFLVLLEESVCYDQWALLAKLYYSLPCFILYSKAKFACYSRCFLTSYFCIPVPYNEKDIFFCVCVSSKMFCRSSKNHSMSASSTLLVWQNIVHWRREWQSTSVFLPWEPHEQYEKEKDRTLKLNSPGQ